MPFEMFVNIMLFHDGPEANKNLLLKKNLAVMAKFEI